MNALVTFVQIFDGWIAMPSPALHPAPASASGMLCRSCVRLSLGQVSPSVLTTCSTPLPSVAGHPIAARLGAGYHKR